MLRNFGSIQTAMHRSRDRPLAICVGLPLSCWGWCIEHRWTLHVLAHELLCSMIPMLTGCYDLSLRIAFLKVFCVRVTSWDNTTWLGHSLKGANSGATSAHNQPRLTSEVETEQILEQSRCAEYCTRDTRIRRVRLFVLGPHSPCILAAYRSCTATVCTLQGACKRAEHRKGAKLEADTRIVSSEAVHPSLSGYLFVPFCRGVPVYALKYAKVTTISSRGRSYVVVSLCTQFM